MAARPHRGSRLAVAAVVALPGCVVLGRWVSTALRSRRHSKACAAIDTAVSALSPAPSAKPAGIVELAQVHDCLRGELATIGSMLKDVMETHQDVQTRVAACEEALARMLLLLAVFRSHSSAEDEILWPLIRRAAGRAAVREGILQSLSHDHDEEEQQLSAFVDSLRLLGSSLRQFRDDGGAAAAHITSLQWGRRAGHERQATAQFEDVSELYTALAHELAQHLWKEETIVMPAMAESLSPEELRDCVGAVVSTRSSESLRQVIALALQHLPGKDREDMLSRVSESVAGTYFAEWLCTVEANIEAEASEHSSCAAGAKAVAVAPFAFATAAPGPPQSRQAAPEALVEALRPRRSPPTFHKPGVLGCEHYARACRVQAPCCGAFFGCHRCHDKSPPADCPQARRGEAMPANSVSRMQCMRCGASQDVAGRCTSEVCRDEPPIATYYCDVCKLFNAGDTYHCQLCNVCRRGQGLGIDFRHCLNCNACIAIGRFDTHPCVSNALQGDCPVCMESLFRSTNEIKSLSCGHPMHTRCLLRYMDKMGDSEITCPTCRKVSRR